MCKYSSHSGVWPSLVLCGITAVATLTATAGVKYWDNPGFRAYDVGDYVQDGLVVNYDGIRNQGPNAPHDSAAMTWVNSANPGTYDMTRYSYVDSAWAGSNANGSWTDTGFLFDKKSVFHESQSFTYPTKFSIQTLVDANSVDQSGIGYLVCGHNATSWQACSVGIRSNNWNGWTNSYYFVCENGTGSRPSILPTLESAKGAQERHSYATAILDVTNGVMFAGTTAPWKKSGWKNGHAVSSTKTPDAVTVTNGICLGGHYPRTDELFKGTIKSVRFYDRCLSDTEVAYNRMIDEARYFGRSCRAPIPVTNVVVAVTIPGVADDHFALDAEGYTFTAPASRTVNGARYVLSGYTLETWNGSAWGAAENRSGNSYDASASGLVRLTWQYARPEGEGQFKVYDVDDYVQDGLCIFLDGIRNAGATAEHDSTATKWVNLGTGSDSTLNLGTDSSSWMDDGFFFAGRSSFTVPFGRDKAANSTMQLLATTIPSQQNIPSGSHQYILSGSYNNYAVSTYGNTIDFRSFLKDPNVSVPANDPVGYATMIVTNGEKKASIVFAGTTIPTSGKGYQSFDSLSSGTINNLTLGGWGGEKVQFTIGGVKFLRYYNRVLTEAEIAHNRRVDNYRYFGILEPEATNVVVQSTYSYLQGNEKAGPYEVDGSYTFTAPANATVKVNGKEIEYACDGYTVETQDGSGWKEIDSGADNSYLYKTSAGTVRLTWKWRPVSGIRTAADYSIDDLSPAGLALHYDGKLNQGVGAERSTTSTKWINLGSAGSSMNLSTQRKSGDTSAWGDKGYEYAGNTYFQSEVNTYVWGGSYSAQILADAKYADNKHVSGNYLAASTWNRFGMQVYGDKNLARSNVQGIGNDAMRVTYPTEDGIDYMTVIADAAAKVDYAFSGTKIPTGGSAAAGYRPYTTQLAPYSNYFRLGGWGGGNNGQGLTGTIFTFRYYDRVLTEEELIRNRNVDSVRYFGELGVTNVLVTTKYADVAGDEEVLTEAAGAYKVEGSHTFSATMVADENGDLKAVAGYYLYKWDGGSWKKQGFFTEDTYTYIEGESPATVKLEWSPPPPGLLIILR
ncbi:MAG: hypothetical protein J6P13_08075 [Kiritimatiellae bacterium]|nr:hypothetical protein [Kiritimatiellia bacterium]